MLLEKSLIESCFMFLSVNEICYFMGVKQLQLLQWSFKIVEDSVTKNVINNFYFYSFVYNTSTFFIKPVQSLYLNLFHYISNSPTISNIYYSMFINYFCWLYFCQGVIHLFFEQYLSDFITIDDIKIFIFSVATESAIPLHDAYRELILNAKMNDAQYVKTLLELKNNSKHITFGSFFVSFYMWFLLFLLLVSILTSITSNTYFKKITSGNMYFAKAQKLMENDLGPFSELKFLFLFMFSAFWFCFMKCLQLNLNLVSYNDFYLFYLCTLLSICLVSPFIILIFYGFYFLTYIKGTNGKLYMASNFFFDVMAIIAYFSRFFLQLIRIIIFSIFYYLLHEFVFSNILNLFSYTLKTPYVHQPLYIFAINVLRLCYELLDFFMLFSLQLSSFFSVIFLLFSFLFTSNIITLEEKFIEEKKNEDE